MALIMKKYWSLFLLVAFCTTEEILAQKVILLDNPSFENGGSGAAGTVPSGWINLGSEDQTPPDIQPGSFQVSMPPQDGDTYLGLVVREVNTWEGVGQPLMDFLEKGATYTFSLWLARSNTYRSGTPLSREVVNLNAPTILKIWGYNTSSKQEELLAESQAVSHSKWVRYEFMLTPTLADYDELDLMAYYALGFEQTNGNLLIDNCSAIVKVEK